MSFFDSIMYAFDNNYLLIYLFIIVILMVMINIVSYFSCPKIDKNITEERTK